MHVLSRSETGNFNKLQNGKNPGDHSAQGGNETKESLHSNGGWTLAISISPTVLCAKLLPQAFGLLVGFLWSRWLDNQTTRYIA